MRTQRENKQIAPLLFYTDVSVIGCLAVNLFAIPELMSNSSKLTLVIARHCSDVGSSIGDHALLVRDDVPQGGLLPER